MTKKKKNARERRALVGALCTAAVIIAGSTFAWFTSSDEVTNRLTASADYGVSIVEDFTPPKQMVPGQEVDKDVAIVNTGNIDAFARLHLINDLQVSRVKYVNLIADSTQAHTKVATDDTDTATTAAEKKVHYYNIETGEETDVPETEWNSTYATQTAKYQKMYTIVDFANATNTWVKADNLTPTPSTANNAVDLDKGIRANVLDPNEVTTLQAGGQLVVKAGKSVVPQAVRSGDDGEVVYVQATDTSNRPVWKDNSDKYYIYVDGEYYEVTKTENAVTKAITYSLPTDGTDPTKTMPATVTASSLTPVATQIKFKDFSGSSQFLPETTGLYIFRRTVNSDPSEISDSDLTDGTAKIEYSGYYYIAGTNPGDGRYYALKTKVKNASATGADVANNTYTTTPYIDATIIEADDIVQSIAGLQLKTTTALQDYAKYFPGDSEATPAVEAASRDDAGYYKNATVKYTWYAGNDAITSMTAENIKTATKIEVRYTFETTAATETDATKADDVVFFINLASGWATNWTYVAETDATPVAISDKTNTIGYFYYNNVVPAGKTTAKLIDSVILDGSVTQFAFSDLVYDLGVKLDSAQVVYDDNNRPTTDAVAATWHTDLKDVNVGVAYDNADNTKFSAVNWTTYSVKS